MGNMGNRIAHFYSLPLNSFLMPIFDIYLLIMIVSSDVLGLNASDKTLDSFSVSHCIKHSGGCGQACKVMAEMALL